MKLINNLFLNSIVVLMLLMTSARVVKADILPPSPQNIAISTSFDKAASPATLYIWNHASGGYDSGNNARWGLNYWTCTSDSDPAAGKCSTKKYQSGWDTYIALEFVEQRSGATQILNLYAVRTAEWVPPSACGGDGGKYADEKPMNTSAQNTCRGQTTAGVSLVIRIDPAELKKIPVGGIWKAGLKIILHNSSDSERYDWQAAITLNVTDNNNQKIYLPEFGEAQPQIDLNLRPLPGTTASQ
ncbi:MAG: CfaE/CblD family pilus tip adhesin, partial [Acinetobacter sp.]